MIYSGIVYTVNIPSGMQDDVFRNIIVGIIVSYSDLKNSLTHLLCLLGN